MKHAIGAIVFGALALFGCASASEGETPAWMAENEADGAAGYPSFRDVPRVSDANTDAAHWAGVQAELLAAGEAVKNNPRAQPATAADDPALFLDQARAELERAREAHE
jgi:hypothetical protein